MEAIGGFDKLCRDAHAITRLAHAALDYIGHAQLPRDFRDGRVFAFEVKGRCSGGHFETLDFCQHIQQFLADAIRRISFSLSPLKLAKASTATDFGSVDS